MSLPTPSETVGKLQTSLQAKAKAEPAFRFYALWDKVYRKDVLLEAYLRCRANAGAAGVDRETFEQIEARGREQWLETLREELDLRALCPPAPAARMDTEEQRRPAASRHSVHLRPRGTDGGGAGHRPHLRGGPAATAVRLSPRAGRQDGSPTGLLACDAAWAAGGSGRGLTRLFRSCMLIPSSRSRLWMESEVLNLASPEFLQVGQGVGRIREEVQARGSCHVGSQ